MSVSPTDHGSALRRLAVVPTDPLDVYTEKGVGWWLAEYYNPRRFFDEVYCLSPWEPVERHIYGMQVVPTPADQFARRLRELRIDIVRAYGGFDACDVACGHKVDGIPVVVSVHDTNPALLHDSILQADHVLAVSKAVRELLIRRGVPAERICDLPNRVDLDVFRPVEDPALREAFRRRYPGRYRILHVGRATPQKNPDTLIRALALLGPDYVALFVGPGDTTPYRELARECGVADRCHFVGPVPNSELPHYYSFCDCFCTPSRWEGFGIVFIEALACRSVVVASDIAPLNEYIVSGKHGLLIRDYEDPAAVAAAIRAACTDAGLRATLREQARAAAEPFAKARIDQVEADLYARFLSQRSKETGGGLAPRSTPAERRAYYLSRLPVFRILTEANLSDETVRRSPELLEQLRQAGLEVADLTPYWKRVEFIARSCRGRVLELGCGCGNITRYISENPAVSHVTAVDMLPEYVEVLRSLKLPKVEAVCGDVCQLEARGPFDCVVLAELLEHLTDAEERALLGRLRPAVAPGGVYVITTPIGYMPDPDHIRGFKRDELAAHLRAEYGEILEMDDNGIQQFAVVAHRSADISPPASPDAALAADLATRSLEKQKWDRIYTGYVAEESDVLRRFNAEFAKLVEELLPQGGSVLEAGCGSGYQSLGLARRGKFDVALMDFSEPALESAKDLFRRSGMQARFLPGDVNQPGQPEYDLVFNAGVLEHYTFDEQVRFLKGMASRSRRYVLVLVPNSLCYWYWVWRLQASAAGAWPYGKEVPRVDLKAAYEAAGLRFLGQTFVGRDWAEDFIANLSGLSEPLKRQILEIHRLPAVPEAQKAYLLAALGTADARLRKGPGRWQAAAPREEHRQAELVAALVDGLALRVQAEQELGELSRQSAELRAAVRTHEQQAQQLRAELARQQASAADLNAALEDARREIQRQAELRERLLREQREAHEQAVRGWQQTLDQMRQEARDQEALRDQLLREAERRHQTELNAAQQALERTREELAGLRATLDSQNAFLAELTSSMGWAVLTRLHRLRRLLAPDGSWRHRALRWSYRGAKRVKRGLVAGARAAGRGLKRLLRLHPMTWYAYAFDRFKRARSRLCPPDLRAVRCPGQPGLVSIVLPVYNGEDYLCEALDSVRAQSYTNFELIVVNDGSTDGTAAILEEYQAREPRLRVVHQENQKLPRALSNGFRLARGEFLTWTSADNRLKPDFLAEMVACLRRHPRWELAYGDIDIIGEDGQPLRDSGWYLHYQRPPGSEHVFFPTDPSELNIWPNNYVGAAFLYRRRVPYLIGEYSPSLFGLEDYDYWMRVNALLTLRHADFARPVYDYRLHGSSLTARDEEIGITRRRGRLMAFEDFRRSFYLSGLAWLIDAGNSAEPVLTQLRKRIRAAGHVELSAEKADLSRLPRLWVPLVYVKIAAGDPAAARAPADVPTAALRVLVTVGEQPLPPQVDPGWDLCVAVRRAGEPVRLSRPWQGWLLASDGDVLFRALDTRCRTRHLERIQAEIAQPRPARCPISVIICAYRRADRLAKAIESVAAQEVDRAEYEIIVVNNDPADEAVPRLVGELRERYFSDVPDRLRLVDCPLPGLSHARNAGLAEAAGEFLCFLDDDSIAQPGWMNSMLRAFREHPGAGIIGGKVLLREPQPRPTWLQPDWWSYWSHFAPGYTQYTEVEHYWEFPYGANWAARREALLAIGGFRTHYGRRGNDFGGGEELVAAQLARNLGYTVGFEPDSLVVHDVEPSRFTLEHVKRTIRAGILANYQAQRDLYIPLEVGLRGTVRLMWQHYRRSLRRDLSRAERFRQRTYGSAYRTLLWRQLGDRLARLRKAVCARH